MHTWQTESGTSVSLKLKQKCKKLTWTIVFPQRRIFQYNKQLRSVLHSVSHQSTDTYRRKWKFWENDLNFFTCFTANFPFPSENNKQKQNIEAYLAHRYIIDISEGSPSKVYCMFLCILIFFHFHVLFFQVYFKTLSPVNCINSIYSNYDRTLIVNTAPLSLFQNSRCQMSVFMFPPS